MMLLKIFPCRALFSIATNHFVEILSNEALQPFRFSFDIYYKKAINMKK